MGCAEWRKELQRWLEAAWSGRAEREPPRPLVDHAGECPECAGRLEAARLLLHGEELRAAPAPRLAAAVARRLEGRRPARTIPVPRWLAVPAAAGLAAAAAMAVFLLASPLRPASGTVTVRLVLESPGAKEVAVVGDWNRWDPQADRLRDPDGDGVWETEIRVRKGREYRYQFLIDGQEWIPDPRTPLQVENGFGGESSVLQI